MGTGGHEQTTFRIQNNNNANFRIKAKDDTSSTVWIISGDANTPIAFEVGGKEAFRIIDSNGNMGFNSATSAVNGYEFRGDMLVTGNLMVEKTGITIAPDWVLPRANLYISGATAAGDGIKIESAYDAFLRLDADINDSPETDNAYILMTQDGGTNSGILGFCPQSNTGPLGPITGALTHAILLENDVRAGNIGGLQLATNNIAWMTITSGGAVGIGSGFNTPSGHFHVSGSGIYLDYDNLHTADPQRKGEIYRNGSNQLFISAG